MDLVGLGWPRALLELSRHCEAGALRYGDRNWEHGQPMSWFVDSAYRHFLQFLAGETGEDHLKAVAWNILGALETRERVAEGLLPEVLMDLELGPDPSKIAMAGLNLDPVTGAPVPMAVSGDATPLPKWTAPYAADT